MKENMKKKDTMVDEKLRGIYQRTKSHLYRRSSNYRGENIGVA